MSNERNGSQTIPDLNNLENILNLCTLNQLPSGDVLYSIENFNVPNLRGKQIPFCLVFSPQGLELQKNYGKILKLLSTPYSPPFSYYSSFITQFGAIAAKDFFNKVNFTNAGSDNKKERVAVKILDPNTFGRGMTCTETFFALRTLQEKGFFTPELIAATPSVIITGCIEAKKISLLNKGRFYTFLETLDEVRVELIKEKKWNSHWYVDADASNFKIKDLKNSDLRKRFYCIDPVAHEDDFPISPHEQMYGVPI